MSAVREKVNKISHKGWEKRERVCYSTLLLWFDMKCPAQKAYVGVAWSLQQKEFRTKIFCCVID